jgi:hypothetical protein
VRRRGWPAAPARGKMIGMWTSQELEEIERTFKANSIRVESGLSEGELTAAEESFGFRFPPDLRELLARMIPVGEEFPDWRNHSRELLDWLDEPIEAICDDVEDEAFWHAGWGERPADVDDAIEEARSLLTRQPQLIPIFGHRFLPATPVEEGNPVFSVTGSDVRLCAVSLRELFREEFGARLDRREETGRRIAFWSELAERSGDRSSDLE